MKYNREHYEKLIDETPLFGLNKEKQPSLYSREAMKLVEALYCYLMAVNEKEYEPYGMEIVDTAKRCIENFDSGAGRFLNYFHAAWKRNYRHLAGKSYVKNTFHGLHFTEEEERNYRKYLRLARARGIDTGSPEFDRKVAEAMGLSAENLKALQNMLNSRPVSGICRNEEGGTYSLIEQLDSGFYADSAMLQREDVLELLDRIEQVFDGLQERQKPVLSCILTSKLSLRIAENQALSEMFREKHYYQEWVDQECLRRDAEIKAKEIAEQYGVTEASVSRSWRKFKEKAKAGLKKRSDRK